MRVKRQTEAYIINVRRSMSDIVLLRVQRMLFTFLSPQSHTDLSLRKSYLLYQATPSYVGQRVLWLVKPFSFVQVKKLLLTVAK